MKIKFIAFYIREYEHIVLVHYRDVSEREEVTSLNKQNICYTKAGTWVSLYDVMAGLTFQGQQTGGQVYQFAPILSTQNVSYNQYIGDSSDIYQQSSTSPGVAEVNSNLEGSASSSEFGQALKMLKEQLSIGDEHVNSVDPHYIQPESLDSLQFLEYSDIDHLAQPTTVYQRPENNKLERCYGGNFGAQYSAKNDSNKLERCYGGYVGGAEYHSSNLMLVKNGSGPSGTPKLYSIGFDTQFFLSISSLDDFDAIQYSGKIFMFIHLSFTSLSEKVSMVIHWL